MRIYEEKPCRGNICLGEAAIVDLGYHAVKHPAGCSALQFVQYIDAHGVCHTNFNQLVLEENGPSLGISYLQVQPHNLAYAHISNLALLQQKLFIY